jgi:branched-chain amino acid transport system substrate-binding protein
MKHLRRKDKEYKMKIRMTKWMGMLVLALVIISLLAMVGCSSKQTPDTTAAPATTSDTAATQTIKIGVVCWFGWGPGIQTVHSLDISSALDNAEGGWNVGGNKYKIKLIKYDDNNNQSTANAAVNRLIYEDKVNYIICENSMLDACLPITEANKVITVLGTPTPPCLSPNNHYSFMPICLNSTPATLMSYYARKFPNFKTMAIALPEGPLGQAVGPVYEKIGTVFGIKVTNIFYPASAQDISTVGTKVKSLNPDFFASEAGSAIVFKAVRDAGYQGLFASLSQGAYNDDVAVAGPASLEGKLGGLSNLEPDPPLTQLCRTYKAAYIAANGEWNALTAANANYYCLKEAMQKAGTLDTDKVAEVIGSGLQFECLDGSISMMARPDLGNNRTVDSVIAWKIKKIVGEKVTVFDSLTIDEAKSAFAQVYK